MDAVFVDVLGAWFVLARTAPPASEVPFLPVLLGAALLIPAFAALFRMLRFRARKFRR